MTIPPSLHCPEPCRSIKRNIEELDDIAQAVNSKRAKRCHSPPNPIKIWLSDVEHCTRSRSAPPRISHTDFDQAQQSVVSNVSRERPIPNFSRSPSPAITSSSEVTSRMTTSHQHYRGTLYMNGIRLDPTGRKIPEDIKVFIDENIRKGRSSPPLTQGEKDKVLDQAEKVASSTENSLNFLLLTEMFPTSRSNIAVGGNSPWSLEPLPNNPSSPYCLAVPKPDYHYGYPTGENNEFTLAQNSVLYHPEAKAFTMPAAGNVLPFLVIEAKSEVTGGTLWHAENQAAGSGTHCVSSMKWLLDQAAQRCTSIKNGPTQSLAFTICLTARQACLYVHFFSSQTNEYWMSFVDSFTPTKSQDIQKCHCTVKNIIDMGVGQRQADVSAALSKLTPFPEHWSRKKQPPVTAGSTPATSFSDMAVVKS